MPSSLPPSTVGQRRHAFTLIELLVVIAIISVLAAMLLPVLGAARERARTQVCANQMKQVALSLYLYADEHEGRLPQVDVANNEIWYTKLDPYLGATPKKTGSGVDPGINQAYQCPSAGPGTGLTSRYARQVAVNTNVMRRIGWSDPSSSYRIGDIPLPSDVMLVADASIEYSSGHCYRYFDRPNTPVSWFAGKTSLTNPDQVMALFQDGDKAYGTTSLGSHPRFRHVNNRLSVWAFTDGHVENVAQGEVRLRNLFPKKW